MCRYNSVAPTKSAGSGCCLCPWLMASLGSQKVPKEDSPPPAEIHAKQACCEFIRRLLAASRSYPRRLEVAFRPKSSSRRPPTTAKLRALARRPEAKEEKSNGAGG